ncbi:Uncharacterised protein [uncultured archaeon]|nr:Uncharacterised protein [uncultured archaeon]
MQIRSQIQRKEAPASSISAVQRKCDKCPKKQLLQRRSSGWNDLAPASPILQDISNSPGHRDLLESFEPGPEHDFDKLRVQPKLAISQPGDFLELEADRVADKVMQMGGTKGQLQTSIYEKAVQRKCSKCKKDDDDKVLQAKETQGMNSAKTIGLDATQTVKRALRSQGQPLDLRISSTMEARLGYDFSHVRIHADEASAQSAKELNARAYTMGDDIVFGAGQYMPGTREGDRLIAHELVHTVQQSRGDKIDLVQREDKEKPPEPSPPDLDKPSKDQEGPVHVGDLPPLTEEGEKLNEVDIPAITCGSDIGTGATVGSIKCCIAMGGKDPLCTTADDAASVWKVVTNFFRPREPPKVNFCDAYASAGFRPLMVNYRELCCKNGGKIPAASNCCRPERIGISMDTNDFKCCKDNQEVLRGPRGRICVGPEDITQCKPDEVIEGGKCVPKPITDIGSVVSETIDHFAPNSATIPMGITIVDSNSVSRTPEDLLGYLVLRFNIGLHVTRNERMGIDVEGHTDSSFSD